MRAFLIAQQTWRNGGDSFDDVCPALLYVAGHSFIELQVLSLAALGVDEIRITGGSFTSRIEALLGDGSQWGIKISYIICQEGKPWEKIFALNRSFFSGTDKLLLVRGNVLFPSDIEIGGSMAMIYSVSLDKFLNAFSSDSGAMYLPEKEIKNILKVGFPKDLIENVHTFIGDTHEAMLKVNEMILNGADKWGTPDFPKSFNRVFIADSARVHRGAELSSACVIGEKCRIEKGAVIGKNASIGEGCIIDRGANIKNSIIDAHTYIGRFAALEDSIISGHRIYSRKTDACTYVPEGFWVDSLKKENTPFREKVTIGERIFAFILWLFTLPLLHRVGCRRKNFKAMFRIGGQDDLEGHFHPGNFEYQMDKKLAPIEAVYSALPEVIKGKMHLCGRVPLTPDQRHLIPSDFLEIYLSARPGIVTISDNLLCDNSFQRKVQDIYLCSKLGFIKRLQLFLESCHTLKHSKVASGYLMEAGFK